MSIVYPSKDDLSPEDQARVERCFDDTIWHDMNAIRGNDPAALTHEPLSATATAALARDYERITGEPVPDALRKLLGLTFLLVLALLIGVNDPPGPGYRIGMDGPAGQFLDRATKEVWFESPAKPTTSEPLTCDVQPSEKQHQSSVMQSYPYISKKGNTNRQEGDQPVGDRPQIQIQVALSSPGTVHGEQLAINCDSTLGMKEPVLIRFNNDTRTINSTVYLESGRVFVVFAEHKTISGIKVNKLNNKSYNLYELTSISESPGLADSDGVYVGKIDSNGNYVNGYLNNGLKLNVRQDDLSSVVIHNELDDDTETVQLPYSPWKTVHH